MVFKERPFQTPLLYRWMEGVTSLSMTIGFVIGGGCVSSTLFLFYILHSIFSFGFHMFPSALTYYLDTRFIDLIAMERAYNISQNLWVYPAYLATMFLEQKTHSHWWVVVRIMCTILILATPQFSIYYFFMWVLCLFTFIQSCSYMMKKNVFKTTLTCCLYHLYLGVVSTLEVSYYKNNENNWMEQLLRYCCYLTFVFYVYSHLC